MRENTKTPHVPDSSGTCAANCAGFFGKKTNQINNVPDVPNLHPTHLMRAHTHAHARTREHKTAGIFSPSHGYIPLHIRHIRHNIVFIKKNGKKGGTVSGTTTINPAQPAESTHQPQNPPPQTIRCTPENAAQFQQLVKNDPQLLGLVQSLQKQNLFPGLRCMSITLTGPQEQRALGLAAWEPPHQPEQTASAPNSQQQPSNAVK